MKKIAIVGASNSFISNGYGRLLKSCDPEEIDIFSLGGNTSLLAIFQLLKFNIVNNYKYVVFNYNMSETHHSFYGTFTKEYLVSFLIWIIDLFKKSNSIPVFLLLPYLYLYRYESINYIYKTIALLYDVPILDMDVYFSRYNDDKLINFDDRTHFAPKFHKMIAQHLLEYIDMLNSSYNSHLVRKVEDIPNFSLLPEQFLNIFPAVLKGTSWKTMLTFRLNMNSHISIPDDLWLCGIWYWTNNGTAPYFSIKTKACHITKNLNLIPKNAFNSREIGYSCLGGEQGGVVSLQNNRKNTIEEPTGTEDIACPKNMNELFVVSMLLCDRNPWQFGYNFLQRYKKEFNRLKKEMIAESVRLLANSCNLY